MSTSRPVSDETELRRAATNKLLLAAKAGDALALEQLMAEVQDSVYRLALRMVSRPIEAEDATQEILIRVMTRLSTFRGDAEFHTWVHRVAVNHLLDRAKSAVESMELSFEFYAEDLGQGLSATSPGLDDELLVEEVRLACTQGMLTCLDRDHRVAYVLGEVFEVSSQDGAYICRLTPAAYRKRLSRARSRIRDFVSQNCGLVSPERAACRCDRRVETAVRLGRINPDALEFSVHDAVDGVREMHVLSDAASLMRSHPDYQAPPQVADRIRRLIGSGEYKLFQ